MASYSVLRIIIHRGVYAYFRRDRARKHTGRVAYDTHY